MHNYKFGSAGPGFSAELLHKAYLAGFFLLLVTLFYYQVSKGEYYFQRAKNNYVRAIPIRAPRGSILDRNNDILARDKASFNISVIPYQIKHKKDALFKEIAAFLKEPSKPIYKNYEKNLKSYFTPVDIMIDIDKVKAMELKENFGDNILINPQPIRYYPRTYQFAHILGYVKKASSLYEKLKKYGYTPLERVGFSGVEQYYDAYLNGEDGGDLIEVDAKARVVGFLGKQVPKRGKDIQLTIDSRIQNNAWACLKDKKGVIILMDSHSGEVLALCSRPSFDPNHFIKGRKIKEYLNDKDSPLINRALQSAYPIGSTFKPVLGLAGLEEGKITEQKTYMCEGHLSLDVTKFRCWSVHRRQNLLEALAHSCNVYFYNLGLALGPDALSRWAKKFGLDSLTGIDLPYEKKGFVPTVRWKQKTFKGNWYAGDTLNFAIGQGFMTATPLEVAVAMNVFASGGCLVAPHLIKRIDNVDSGISAKTPLGLNSGHIEAINKGLYDTIKLPSGTAHILARLNMDIHGKTGTAQTKGDAHAWFSGFFPYKDKTYTICVFLENGGSSHEAVKAAYYFLKKIKEDKLLSAYAD